MKKLFLLLTAAVTAFGAGAQSNNQSIVFVKRDVTKKLMEETNAPIKLQRPASNAKGTATTGAWFNYTNIMTSSASKFYNNPMYQDSNVIFSYNGTPGGIWEHGFGLSFDPTDSAYFGGNASGVTSAGPIQDFTQIPEFRVTQGNAYSVDSIAFLFKYDRHDNANDDTLYIELIKAQRTSPTTQGVYVFHYTSLPNVSPDGKPGFATMLINPNNARISDSVPTGSRMIITKVLDATFSADTTANGFSNYAGNGIKLPSAINLNAGEVLLAYVTVRFGQHYTLGTPSASANFARFYAYDISGTGGAPKQNMNSLQSGLVVTDETIYHGAPGDTAGFKPQGHNVAIPSIAYVADGLTTDFSMHVNCPSCPELNVAKIGNITNISAYPNPANTQINVPFALKNAANVTVSLTNTVGQVLASQKQNNTTGGNVSFSTSELANGVYFYSVEANGERMTGKFVIAH